MLSILNTKDQKTVVEMAKLIEGTFFFFLPVTSFYIRVMFSNFFYIGRETRRFDKEHVDIWVFYTGGFSMSRNRSMLSNSSIHSKKSKINLSQRHYALGFMVTVWSPISKCFSLLNRKIGVLKCSDLLACLEIALKIC